MESRIRLMICDLYSCVYKNPIIIRKLNPIGYQIALPLSTIDKPFSISIEAEGETFYKLLEAELRLASLNTIENFELKLVKP